MAQEKVRVYALAKMLNMESKVLLDICQELGYDVKNQLSGLDPDQRDAIEQRIKRGHGGGGTAVAAPPKAVAPTLSVVDRNGKFHGRCEFPHSAVRRAMNA